MKGKRIVLTVWMVWFLFLPLSAQELNHDLNSGFDSILPMDAYNFCKKMASPEFAGRFTGNDAYKNAVNWAANEFKQWGLKPLDNGDGYLQPFPAPYTMVKSTNMTVELPECDKEISLKAGEDFLPLLFTDSGEHTAELVFAGWGISAPELDYDDYAGINVQNKFILCFRGTPDRNESGFRKHDQHRYRMQVAKNKGALGIFYIYSDPIANPNGDWIEGFTPAVISESVADTILAEKNIKVSDLREDLLKYKKPLSFSLNARVHYQVEAEQFPAGIGYNIVGYIPGRDAKLKNECIVIGAHFDHCGLQAGLLFPGANDNASGSAVVMEIAQAFTKLSTSPKRPILFALFGGEEMGLKGSHYFVENMPQPFEKVDAMFNFDMVGEGDGARCSYSPNQIEFKQNLDKSNQFVQIIQQTRELRSSGGGSDYAPFNDIGITCATFSSNGPHLYYHRTGDTIYRINPDIMADIARVAFISAYNWANR